MQVANHILLTSFLPGAACGMIMPRFGWFVTTIVIALQVFFGS
jgi:hypothetical protein